MPINWNPIASGLNFTNDNDMRLLVGDVGSGTGIDQINNSTYFNQIVLACGQAPIGIGTRITQSYIANLRTIINNANIYYDEPVFNFVEDLTSNNLHNVLVELRQALNDPVGNVGYATSMREREEDPYNGVLMGDSYFNDTFRGTIGKGSSPGAIGARRCRTLINLDGTTRRNVKLYIQPSHINAFEEFNVLVMVTSGINHDSGSVLFNIPRTSFTVGQEYLINLGNLAAGENILLATFEEFNSLGGDPATNDFFYAGFFQLAVFPAIGFATRIVMKLT